MEGKRSESASLRGAMAATRDSLDSRLLLNPNAYGSYGPYGCQQVDKVHVFRKIVRVPLRAPRPGTTLDTISVAGCRGGMLLHVMLSVLALDVLSLIWLPVGDVPLSILGQENAG